MFQGILIILGGIYLLVKIDNFGGMGRLPPPHLYGKFHHFFLLFLLNPFRMKDFGALLLKQILIIYKSATNLFLIQNNLNIFNI
jgi:hypothetical protein